MPLSPLYPSSTLDCRRRYMEQLLAMIHCRNRSWRSHLRTGGIGLNIMAYVCAGTPSYDLVTDGTVCLGRNVVVDLDLDRIVN